MTRAASGTIRSATMALVVLFAGMNSGEVQAVVFTPTRTPTRTVTDTPTSTPTLTATITITPTQPPAGECLFGDANANGVVSLSEVQGVIANFLGAGKSLPPCTTVAGPRLVDNGDGTLSDRQTGLMWELKTGSVDSPLYCQLTSQCGDPRVVNNFYTWSVTVEAADGSAFTNFLERLNGKLCATDTCTGLGGHSDWRMPTIAELKTILDASVPGCGSGSACIASIFGPTRNYVYWSVTTDANFPDAVWTLDFGDATVVDANKTDYFDVRAVRGGP